MSLYQVSSEAQYDLFEIWSRIAADSVDLADRIEAEFHDLFSSLARMPGQGRRRADLTDLPALFFPLYSFLIIYQPTAEGVRILAVLRARRDVRRILHERHERGAY